jgi:hypothetical protein
MEVHEPVQSIGPALRPFQPLIQVAIRHDSSASLRCRLPDGRQEDTDLLGLAPSGDIGLKLREWSSRGATRPDPGTGWLWDTPSRTHRVWRRGRSERFERVAGAARRADQAPRCGSATASRKRVDARSRSGAALAHRLREARACLERLRQASNDLGKRLAEIRHDLQPRS